MTTKKRTLDSLEWVRARTVDLLKDFPADKALHQPSRTDNHAVWTLGHLAVTDEWMHGMLDDKFQSKLPESYGKIFGYGSKCESNPAIYPTLAEVRKHFEAARAGMLKAANAASEQALAAPLGEKGGGFASDAMDAMIKAAWHEGWHAGQLAGIRKSLGLKPSM